MGKIVRPGGIEASAKVTVSVSPKTGNSTINEKLTQSKSIEKKASIGTPCNDDEIGWGTKLLNKLGLGGKKVVTIGKADASVSGKVGVSGDVLCVNPGAAIMTATGAIAHGVENTAAGQNIINREQKIDAAIDEATK